MKFVKTKTLLSSVIFKTIMVSLHRGRFLVVHENQVFLWIPGLSLTIFFAILGTVSPQF